jgi:hypothetical protein
MSWQLRPDVSAELLWIPLGAGQTVVRTSGRLFETMSALAQRRRRCDLYHSALIVTVPAGRFVIEVGPIPDCHGERRGVVAEGPVGLRWLGRFRIFRYEVRRWQGGEIPDESYAVVREHVDVGARGATRLLDLVASIPTPVWGRDELDAGEMWNSNSVVSWLLERSGAKPERITMPSGGRAPGWDAGMRVARRPVAPAP